MASLTFMRLRDCIAHFRLKSVPIFRQVPSRGVSSASSTDEEKNLDETDIEQLWAEEEEQARLEELQNVSGLPLKYHQQVHGEIVEPPFKDLYRRRKMYTAYGSKSGEDPRLLWPSRQEVARMQAEEVEDEAPLLEKIQLMRQEQEDALRSRTERHRMVEKNMAQMSKWISEYHKKVENAELEIQKKKEKKEALLDEARDYFGYRIKANDPKFQLMVEEKQERERKEAKEQRKKEKAKKLADRLQQDVLAMKLTTGTENKQEKSS